MPLLWLLIYLLLFVAKIELQPDSKNKETISLLFADDPTDFVSRCNIFLRETPNVGIEKKDFTKRKYFTTAISAAIAYFQCDTALKNKQGIEEIYNKHQIITTAQKDVHKDVHKFVFLTKNLDGKKIRLRSFGEKNDKLKFSEDEVKEILSIINGEKGTKYTKKDIDAMIYSFTDVTENRKKKLHLESEKQSQFEGTVAGASNQECTFQTMKEVENVDINSYIAKFRDRDVAVVQKNVEIVSKRLCNLFLSYAERKDNSKKDKDKANIGVREKSDTAKKGLGMESNEASLQALIMGILDFNFKRRENLNVYAEHSADRSRPDIKMISRKTENPVGIILELKTDGTSLASAIKQAQDNGYVEISSLRTQTENFVVAAVNPFSETKVQTKTVSFELFKDSAVFISHLRQKGNDLERGLEHLFFQRGRGKNSIVDILKGQSISSGGVRLYVNKKDEQAVFCIEKLEAQKKFVLVSIIRNRNRNKLAQKFFKPNDVGDKEIVQTLNLEINLKGDSAKTYFKQLPLKPDDVPYVPTASFKKIKEVNFLEGCRILLRKHDITYFNKEIYELNKNFPIKGHQNLVDIYKGIFRNQIYLSKIRIFAAQSIRTSDDGAPDLVLLFKNEKLVIPPVVIKFSFGKSDGRPLERALKIKNLRPVTDAKEAFYLGLTFNRDSKNSKDIIKQEIGKQSIFHDSPERRTKVAEADPSGRPLSRKRTLPADCPSSQRRRRRSAVCLIGMNDVLDFKGKAKNAIDGTKFLTALKTNKDLGKNDQLLAFVEREESVIEGHHKELVTKVIENGGYDPYMIAQRSKLCIRTQNTLSRKFNKVLSNQKFGKGINAIMLSSTINGLRKAFQDRDHEAAGKTIGSVAYSFLFAPIETAAISRTKSMTKNSKLLSRFAVGVLSSIFDAYDIAESSAALYICTKTQTCSEIEAERYIVNIAFSSFSLGLGITAVLCPPLAPFVAVGQFVLFVIQSIYTASSIVREYSSKYDLFLQEEIELFFRSLIFMEPSEKLKTYIEKKEKMTQLFDQISTVLGDHDHMYAYAGGVEYITGHLKSEDDPFCKRKNLYIGTPDDYTSLHSCRFQPGNLPVMINMQETDERNTKDLSRITPTKDFTENEILCFPKNSDPSSTPSKTISSAKHECKHAIVLADKRKKLTKDKYIFYALNSVVNGFIRGSNMLQNVFSINEGMPTMVIEGGNHTVNHFIFYSLSFTGKITPGMNSVNIYDLSAIGVSMNEHFYSHRKIPSFGTFQIGCFQEIIRDQRRFNYFALQIRLDCKKTNPINHDKNHVVAQRRSYKRIECTNQVSENFTISSGGGYRENFKDIIYNCKHVVMAPFTSVLGEGDGFTIMVDLQGFHDTHVQSIIKINGSGFLIFSDINILIFNSTLHYSRTKNILNINIMINHDFGYTSYHLEVYNFLSSSTFNFAIQDKNSNSLVLDLAQMYSDSSTIDQFSVQMHRSFKSFDDAFRTFKLLQRDYKGMPITLRSGNDVAIFGSNKSDLINLSYDTQYTKVFSMGNAGHDVYTLNNDSKPYEVLINNYSDDLLIDIIHVPKLSSFDYLINVTDIFLSFEAAQGSILCKLHDYLKNEYYQHLLIENHEKELFVPGVDEKLWYVLYPIQENVFVLKGDFYRDTIVIYSCGSVDYTYNENDLVIKDDNCIFSVTVILSNYLVEQKKFRNIAFYLWDGKGNNFTRLTLPVVEKGQLTELRGKLEELKMYYQVYEIDYKQNQIISHNQNPSLVRKIGFVSFNNEILPSQIFIYRKGVDLIFKHSLSNNTARFLNWDRSEIFRPSFIEFDFGAICLRGIEKYNSSSIQNLRSVMKVATENVNFMEKTQGKNYKHIKCLAAVRLNHECLSFFSVNDQLSFLRNECPNVRTNLSSDNFLDEDLFVFAKVLMNNLIINNYDEAFTTECGSNFSIWQPRVKFIAIAKNDMPLFNFLLRSDLSETNENNQTLLHVAVLYDNLNIVKLLVDNGININTKDRSGNRAYDLAMSQEGMQSKKIGNLLEEQHNVLDQQLFEASRDGNSISLAYLLTRGAAIEAKDENGNRALHHAVSSNNIENVLTLLHNEANVYAKNYLNKRPLDMAHDGNFDVVKKILLDKLLFDFSNNNEKHYDAQTDIVLSITNPQSFLQLEKFCTLEETLFFRVVQEIVTHILADERFDQGLKMDSIIKLVNSSLNIHCFSVNHKVQLFINICKSMPPLEMISFEFIIARLFKTLVSLKTYGNAEMFLKKEVLEIFHKFSDSLRNLIFSSEVRLKNLHSGLYLTSIYLPKLGSYVEQILSDDAEYSDHMKSVRFFLSGQSKYDVYVLYLKESIQDFVSRQCWQITDGEKYTSHIGSTHLGNDLFLKTEINENSMDVFGLTVKVGSKHWSLNSSLMWEVETVGKHVAFKNLLTREYLSSFNYSSIMRDGYFNQFDDKTIGKLIQNDLAITTNRLSQNTLWLIEPCYNDDVSSALDLIYSENNKNSAGKFYANREIDLEEEYTNLKYEHFYSTRFDLDVQQFQLHVGLLISRAACEKRKDLTMALLKHLKFDMDSVIKEGKNLTEIIIECNATDSWEAIKNFLRLEDDQNFGRGRRHLGKLGKRLRKMSHFRENLF